MENSRKHYKLLQKGTIAPPFTATLCQQQWSQKFLSIAGHCSIDPTNPEIFYQTSHALKNINIDILRGGVWKPRTSPYSFRGSDASLAILIKAKEQTGLPVLTEVLNSHQVDEALSAGVDVIQIGTKNSLNYSLLESVGEKLLQYPHCSVVLKHGLHMGTPQEFLCAAEYIALQGTYNILLCLRGITPSGQGGFRYQIDSANVLPLQELTWAPILFDPSHSTGKSQWVCRSALAAAAYGCNGLNIECHINASEGICDDPQQAITPSVLQKLLQNCKKIQEISNHGTMRHGTECGAVG